jgi:hypothetical protein
MARPIDKYLDVYELKSWKEKRNKRKEINEKFVALVKVL